MCCNTTLNRRRRPSRRRGLTLVEMLIAMALTLLMMGTVVQVFDMLGRGVADSRSKLEMTERMRNVRIRLLEDLAGLTCPTFPRLAADRNAGYTEIVEGPARDMTPTLLGVDADGVVGVNTPGVVHNTALGDYDDVLAMTVYRPGEPFVGRIDRGNGNIQLIQSEYAEIIWFAVENLDIDDTSSPLYRGRPGMRTLYRRVLVIAPRADLTLMQNPQPGDIPLPTDNSYYDRSDISARVVNGTLVPNTLGDLTLRQNRFAHSATYPHVMDRSMIHPLVAVTDRTTQSPLRPLDGIREGEDIVLRDVAAFDVRVYDPMAPINSGSTGQAVSPGDPGWSVGGTLIGRGAYVDLGYNAGASSWFSKGNNSVLHGAGLTIPTWDTWPMAYESDGVDQDGDGLVDEGSDGFDSPNQLGNFVDGVDDAGELESPPPYHLPLRGLQVRLRVYDPGTRQLREVSLIQNFVATLGGA